MPVRVTISEADVYYKPTQGDVSPSHDISNLIPGPMPTVVANVGPVTPFVLSNKHKLTGQSAKWLILDDDQFVRFKNGGKRKPSGSNSDNPVKTVGLEDRSREDRTKELVEEGDVGPYKKGFGNLYKANLNTATSQPPAHWTANNPPAFKTVSAPHVQQRMNRDHQNNQAALKLRGGDPTKGTAITLPQWIHMNGYTFGEKAKSSTKKNPLKAEFDGQSRTQWISRFPSEALFKEMYHTIRLYDLSDQLTFEIVGSYRYLYKLNVKTMGYKATKDLDNLLMHYLKRAKESMA